MKFIFQNVAIASILLTLVIAEQDVQDQWKHFKKIYHKEYRSIVEESLRFKIFAKNFIEINKHNKLFKKAVASFEMALNPYSDMDKEELKQFKMGIAIEKKRQKKNFFWDRLLAIAEQYVQDQWKHFKKIYQKKYRSNVEESLRFKIFAKNFKEINKHNKLFEKGVVSFEMALNPYSDMDKKELKQFKMGIAMEEKSETLPYVELYTLDKIYLAIPDSFDWRVRGAVTAVKHQGECGSCWAFASTGALEGQYFLKKQQLPVLSEQNLVDCVYQRDGCKGGWMHEAYTYIANNSGINSEKSYPYEATSGQCRFRNNEIAATCRGYLQINNNENALKQAVAQKGPVAVAIDADHGFQHYSKGIYDEPNCTQNVTHAVLVVGYGSENGKDYWLVKNSWGTQWGEQGYIKMSRNKQNQCAIASYAIIPIV